MSVCLSLSLSIYIYIYSMYYTIIDVCTTALLPAKLPSDDDSGFRSEAVAQRAPAVSHDTARLCLILVALWD